MYSSKEIADMTFRRRASINTSDHTKDIQSFNLLMAIDGKRSVGTIAREDSYDLDFLTSKINQFLDKGLIEATVGYGARMPNKLMDDLASELSSFVGPVASVLINECVAKMGHQTSNIPPAKALTLLDALSDFIQPQSKAKEFKDRMSIRLKSIK